jgi:DNA-binding CsgD family transcriptional regulator
MTIYFHCNDKFFINGAIALLKSNEIMAAPIEKHDKEDLFNSNDVIVLETACDLTLKDIVTRASLSGAIVLLVLNTPCRIKSIAAWSHNHFSKKIDKNLLIKLIRHVAVYGDDLAEELTLCEAEVMELLFDGTKPDEISLNLNISMKTILSYKKTALAKMGLSNDNSLYLIHYKKLISAKYYNAQ